MPPHRQLWDSLKKERKKMAEIEGEGSLHHWTGKDTGEKTGKEVLSLSLNEASRGPKFSQRRGKARVVRLYSRSKIDVEES